MYTQLRAAGQAEAQRGGRSVVFAAEGPSGALPEQQAWRCLPGGTAPWRREGSVLQPRHAVAPKAVAQHTDPNMTSSAVSTLHTLPPPAVEPIQRSDVNACCLPGGIVFVHSGLIKAVEGRQEALGFVLGHEVGVLAWSGLQGLAARRHVDVRDSEGLQPGSVWKSYGTLACFACRRCGP